MLKRIMCILLASAMLAGNTLPVFADNATIGSSQTEPREIIAYPIATLEDLKAMEPGGQYFLVDNIYIDEVGTIAESFSGTLQLSEFSIRIKNQTAPLFGELSGSVGGGNIIVENTSANAVIASSTTPSSRLSSLNVALEESDAIGTSLIASNIQGEVSNTRVVYNGTADAFLLGESANILAVDCSFEASQATHAPIVSTGTVNFRYVYVETSSDVIFENCTSIETKVLDIVLLGEKPTYILDSPPTTADMRDVILTPLALARHSKQDHGAIELSTSTLFGEGENNVCEFCDAHYVGGEEMLPYRPDWKLQSDGSYHIDQYGRHIAFRDHYSDPGFDTTSDSFGFTEDRPRIINSGSELRSCMENTPNMLYYKLANDISLAGIELSKMNQGYIDLDGHTISMLGCDDGYSAQQLMGHYKNGTIAFNADGMPEATAFTNFMGSFTDITLKIGNCTSNMFIDMFNGSMQNCDVIFIDRTPATFIGELPGGSTIENVNFTLQGTVDEDGGALIANNMGSLKHLSIKANLSISAEGYAIITGVNSGKISDVIITGDISYIRPPSGNGLCLVGENNQEIVGITALPKVDWVSGYGNAAFGYNKGSIQDVKILYNTAMDQAVCAGGVQPENVFYVNGKCDSATAVRLFDFVPTTKDQNSTYTMDCSFIKSYTIESLTGRTKIIQEGNKTTFKPLSNGIDSLKVTLEFTEDSGLPQKLHVIDSTIKSVFAEVTEIRLGVTSVSVELGDTFSIPYTTIPAIPDSNALWGVDNIEILDNLGDGSFSAKAVGEAIITLSIDKCRAQLLVNVAYPVWQSVIDKVTELPEVEELKYANKAAVESIVKLYGQVSEDKLGNISEDIVNRIQASVEKIASLEDTFKAYNAVLARIEKLPDVSLITLSHDSAIQGIYSAIELLSDEFKNKLDTEVEAIKLIAHLNACRDRVNELATNLGTVESIRQRLEGLPTEVTLADYAYITAFYREVFSQTQEVLDQLSEMQLTRLTSLHKQVVSLNDNHNTANELMAFIDNLPAESALTMSDISLILEIKSKYDKAAAEVKALISVEHVEKLTRYVQHISAVQTAEDKRVASEFDAEAQNLITLNTPSVDVTTYERVVTLITKYQQLTQAQRSYVTTYSKLTTIKAHIDNTQLEADELAANTVIALIDALPEYDDLRLTDESRVQSVRTAYDKLNTAQRGLVKNYTILKSLEGRISDLRKAKAKADAFVKKLNKLSALASVAYSDLKDVEKLYKEYLALDEAIQIQVPEAKSKLLEDLYEKILSFEKQTVSDKTYGVRIDGPVGNNVTIKMDCATLDSSRADEVKALKSKIKGRFNKELLVVYDVELLKDGNSVDPQADVTVRIPMMSVFKARTAIEVVIEKDGKFETAKTMVETLDGKQYLSFKTDQVSRMAVIGKEKPFRWLFGWMKSYKNTTAKDMA